MTIKTLKAQQGEPGWYYVEGEQPVNGFTDAILDGSKLIAPAPEGIHSVELANSMLLSAWTQKPVTLPIDGKKYERLLKAKIAESAAKGKKKKVVAVAPVDFAKSFGK